MLVRMQDYVIYIFLKYTLSPFYVYLKRNLLLLRIPIFYKRNFYSVFAEGFC